MSRGGQVIALALSLLLLCVVHTTMVLGAEAEKAAQQLYTDKEREAFDGLYKERIANARNKETRLALAKDLLAASEGPGAGLQYLMLTSAKDLATAAGDPDMTVEALKRLVQLKRGDQKDFSMELLNLQVRQFALMMAKLKTAEDKLAEEKAVHGLGSEIVESALLLANACRAEFDFDSAAKAEALAQAPAAAISSTKLPQLRQGEVISRTLKGLAAGARANEKAKNFGRATWEYLDAGMFQDAARVNAQQPDDGASLLIRAAGEKAQPDDMYAAAESWDKKATGAKETMAQIRLMRASQLYERYLGVGEGTKKEVAKARLLAISKQLGDAAASLRKPTEWVYMVDLPHESASVGFGQFEKHAADKGPVGIAGQKCLTGMMAHAPSKVVYSLKGQYRELSTCYGMATGAGGVGAFKILCDGKEAFKSKSMWKEHDFGVKTPAVINIVGVDRLELITEAPQGMAGSFCMWGDPKVR